MALGLSLLAIPILVCAADVTLAWDPNPEADLAGYKIYHSDTSGGPYDEIPVRILLLEDLTDPQNPEYTITGVEPGRHFWVLTAFDFFYNESGFSNEATDETPPATPTNCIIKSIQ